VGGVKAIVYTRTGPSDVLQLTDVPLAEPGAGEVRVRIVVSGVNPTDWKSRKGGSAGSPDEYPHVPNQDGAGVVDAVGEGVAGLEQGQNVWVWDAAYKRPTGTAQQFVVLPERQVVPLPDGVSFDVGASLGIPALTAHRTLTDAPDGPQQLAPGVLDGVTVLVAGGAGAVGHAAIQLAAWAGATVITTVSDEAKGELAKAAGAHHVVNYKTQDAVAEVLAIAPDGVRIIVEVNPGANAHLDAAVIARGGSIVSYLPDSDGRLRAALDDADRADVRYAAVLTYTSSREQKDAGVAAVSAAAAAGALEVGEAAGLPLTRFPLEQTAAAHDAVEAGVVGKVLIDVG
jgi:NADPH2:quinone reductase